jgi:PEP-CTERM motif
MRIQAFAMGLALAWAAIGGARAAEALFTITGGDRTATFELPLNPTPDVQVAPVFFGILSVPAVVGGSPVTLPELEFFSTEFGSGGFVAGELFNFVGRQFYTGSESSPSFKVGVYPGLRNLVTGKFDTVTVTDPPPMTVPEPSTWTMLLLGFVGLSYAGYRKARTSTTLAA